MFKLGSQDWRERMPSQGLLDACDKAGMKWEARHVPDGVAYSGQEQTAYLRGCDDWEAAHELAHWLLASPERRRLDEFGGGPGQHTREGRELPIVIRDQEAQEDEQLAQALTVALLVSVGMDAGLRRYSTWHMGTLKLDWDELKRRGLLTHGNMPAFWEDPDTSLEVPGPALVWLPKESSISWWSRGVQQGETG